MLRCQFCFKNRINNIAFSVRDSGIRADFFTGRAFSSVFHNIVGSISARLQSPERVRNVVLVGSGVPLTMFIAAKFVSQR